MTPAATIRSHIRKEATRLRHREFLALSNFLLLALHLLLLSPHLVEALRGGLTTSSALVWGMLTATTIGLSGVLVYLSAIDVLAGARQLDRQYGVSGSFLCFIGPAEEDTRRFAVLLAERLLSLERKTGSAPGVPLVRWAALVLLVVIHGGLFMFPAPKDTQQNDTSIDLQEAMSRAFNRPNDPGRGPGNPPVAQVENRPLDREKVIPFQSPVAAELFSKLQLLLKPTQGAEPSRPEVAKALTERLFEEMKHNRELRSAVESLISAPNSGSEDSSLRDAWKDGDIGAFAAALGRVQPAKSEVAKPHADGSSREVPLDLSSPNERSERGGQGVFGNNTRTDAPRIKSSPSGVMAAVPEAERELVRRYLLLHHGVSIDDK